MYIYKLDSEVCNVKERMLPLNWGSCQIDKDKKIIRFTIDPWGARYIAKSTATVKINRKTS